MAIKVKFKKLNNDVVLPHYSRAGDAALDIYSCVDLLIMPAEIVKIPTGFATEFSEDYVGLIYRRSGLASKGIVPLGTAVIDANYRGEWLVTMTNSSTEAYEIKKGDRIAQIIFHKIDNVIVEEVTELSESNRGEGNFGSSGR